MASFRKSDCSDRPSNPIDFGSDRKKLSFDRPKRERLPHLKMSWLKKHNYLEGAMGGILNYEDDNSVHHVQVRVFTNDNMCLEMVDESENMVIVQLASTNCKFGGKRYWFLCPLCNRRIGILYLKDHFYQCSKCVRLTYSSRNRNRRHPLYQSMRVIELADKEDKLNEKLKKRSYKGTPTKLVNRINKIKDKISSHYSLLKKAKKL